MSSGGLSATTASQRTPGAACVAGNSSSTSLRCATAGTRALPWINTPPGAARTTSSITRDAATGTTCATPSVVPQREPQCQDALPAGSFPRRTPDPAARCSPQDSPSRACCWHPPAAVPGCKPRGTERGARSSDEVLCPGHGSPAAARAPSRCRRQLRRCQAPALLLRACLQSVNEAKPPPGS